MSSEIIAAHETGDRPQLSQNIPKSEIKLNLIQPGGNFPLRTSTHIYKQDQGTKAANVDIVINQFSDNILIIVTDISKPGSIFQITRDNSKRTEKLNCFGGSEFLYSVELVLGAESPELVTTARFLAQSLNQEKPILLTLGFKNPKISLAPPKVKSLVSFIKEQL